MNEHVQRNEQHEQAVLGVRELYRQGVAGRPEVHQPGTVDVVVCPQPHRAYLNIRLMSDSPTKNSVAAPAMNASPMIAIAELVRTRDTSPLLARAMKNAPRTASSTGATLL